MKKHREKRKEKLREWRESNPEKVKKQRIEWSAKNKEKRRRQNNNWTAKNREKCKEKIKIWVKENPEKARSLWAIKRARKKNAEGRFGESDIKRILKAQKNKCAVCRKKIKEFHIDHIFPLAKGGSNFPRNLQLLCPLCNGQKHAKDPIDFMQERGLLL